MKLQPACKKVLEYLDKHGSVNTFRLSRNLKMNRAELISLVEELSRNGLTELRSGTVVKIKGGLPTGQKIAKNKDKAVPVSETSEKTKPKKEYSKPEKAKKIQKEEGAQRETSLRQREEAIKKREEYLSAELRKLRKKNALLDKERKGIIQKIIEIKWLEKEKEKIARTKKRLKEEKKKIFKSKALKEDISKLEATLEDLKKKAGIEKRRIKKLKERKIKPKPVSKKTRKPKTKGVKPALKHKTGEHSKKIRVSGIETKKPKLIAKELLQPAIETEEDIYGKFHNLIEREIDLLKEGRIYGAREVHLRIKDMISEVTDTNQRKKIIGDWNRIKEFC